MKLTGRKLSAGLAVLLASTILGVSGITAMAQDSMKPMEKMKM